MADHPLNLVFRFILELLGLGALGYWGWSLGSGGWEYAGAIALPFFAAVIWAVFRAPGETHGPDRTPVPVSGRLRLLLEVCFFGAGILGLYQCGQLLLVECFSVMLLLHYGLSYDRLRWLLTG